MDAGFQVITTRASSLPCFWIPYHYQPLLFGVCWHDCHQSINTP